MNVKLMAAFGGLKALPWFAWGHNSIGPKLVLHSDRIEYRLFRTRTRSYKQVELVNYRVTWRTHNIVLQFEGTFTSFIANTGAEDSARQAIGLLAEKGCPLSPRAAKLLAP